ncbi:type II secretion system protein [Candidatus Saganbacteria bacterium]|nr:type II secretion system protein [Candidatus Saganbacteria bacterium]
MRRFENVCTVQYQVLKLLPMKRQGFTLTELVIVLVIIGILAVVASLSLNSSKSVKLEAGTKKIIADLLYTRNLSLSTAKWYGMSFEVAPVNSYQVYTTDGSSDTLVEDPSNLGKNFIVNLSDLYGGVNIVGVSIGGGNKVEFHPYGRPFNDRSGAAIATTGLITLEYGGSTKTIFITPDTGVVTTP